LKIRYFRTFFETIIFGGRKYISIYPDPIGYYRALPYIYSRFTELKEPCSEKQTRFTQMAWCFKANTGWHNGNFQSSNIEDL